LLEFLVGLEELELVIGLGASGADLSEAQPVDLPMLQVLREAVLLHKRI